MLLTRDISSSRKMRKMRNALFASVFSAFLFFTTSLNAVTTNDFVPCVSAQSDIIVVCPSCGNPDLVYYGYYEDEAQQVFHVTLIVCEECGYYKSLL